MKILIVGLVTNDQLTRIQEEGKKKGHTVDGCYTSDLSLLASGADFKVSLAGKDITSYDLIYLWAVGKRRWEWYTACKYLAAKFKTKIVNQKVIDSDHNYYLTPATDYLVQSQNNLPYPKTLMVFDSSALAEKLVGFEFPVIIKVANGRQGKGVFKIGNLDDLTAKVKEITANKEPAVIREFIPNDGDIRVFTIGYKAIGAMKRTPKSGDFRSNISQGGTGEIFELNKYPEIVYIAEKLSEATRTQIAGVDIMINSNTNKPYILEINPGPQFSGIEKYTKLNVAGKIIEYFESLVL